MRKALVIAVALAGIGALADLKPALAKPKLCAADYRYCITAKPDIPLCAQEEIECRAFNKKNGYIDPSDPVPGRKNLGAYISTSSGITEKGIAKFRYSNSGAATAMMLGAGAVRSDVTNSGVIPASGSAVTNTGVVVKRRAGVTGGAAGPISAPGTAKAKVQ